MTNTNKTSKPKSKTSKKVSKEKMVLSPAEQKLRMKQIMNNNVHTCSDAECQFTYVPMSMKIVGFEEEIDNLCPKCDKKILTELRQYVEDCIELGTKISKVEVANILNGETEDLDSYESDDFESFDTMNFGLDDLGFYDDEAA